MGDLEKRIGTIKHIGEVREGLGIFMEELAKRAIAHDQSKLVPPESDFFEGDGIPPFSKYSENGELSDGYKAFLEKAAPVLRHHYDHNSHHPEHYEHGISGMCLVDLVEMFMDWRAASMRTPGGNLVQSINTNKDRFGVSDQLHSIFINTAIKYGL